MAAPEFQIERENVSFWLKVKPRSARERLAMDSSGELRLELHAPPAEGQANEACVQFFARAAATASLRSDSFRPQIPAQTHPHHGAVRGGNGHATKEALGEGRVAAGFSPPLKKLAGIRK